MWFGTTGAGVYRFDGKTVTRYTTKNGLNSNTIYSILEDKSGKIWIGTDSGLCQYNPSASSGSSQKNFIRIPIPGSVGVGMAFSPFTESQADTSEISVISMLEDKHGMLWIGTEQGVLEYNGQNFTHFLVNDAILNESRVHLNHVAAMLEDRSGKIWFTTWFEGVCCYDGKTITRFKPNGEVWFAGIFEDKQGNIWVGSRGHGAYRYDPSTATGSGGQDKAFTNPFAGINILNTCVIGPIVEDKAGNLWFGTEYGKPVDREVLGGLWRYNPSLPLTNPKALINYTLKDGLPNNAVFCIVKDKSGSFWIGTRGMALCKLDPTAVSSNGGNGFKVIVGKGVR